MMSKAPDVPTYIREAPPERRPALEILRSLCLEHLPRHEEVIEYGMPSYRLNGKVEIAFASQKQYISVYGLKQEVVDRYRDALPADTGKGCIRFRKPEQINFTTIADLLRDTAASRAQTC